MAIPGVLGGMLDIGYNMHSSNRVSPYTLREFN